MTDTARLSVTVFDYGAGNLHSLVKALERAGADVRVDSDPSAAVRNTDALVLPGVGAFTPAAARMAPGLAVMREALQAGLPCLGVCLGMQLLFDGSDEGPGEGLGFIPGRVTRIDAERVPQIGWNYVEAPLVVPSSTMPDVSLDVAYYANSFVCRPDDSALDTVMAWSKHGRDRFPAWVARGNVVGTQFHPEKSSAPGLAFIETFIDCAANVARLARESRMASVPSPAERIA